MESILYAQIRFQAVKKCPDDEVGLVWPIVCSWNHLIFLHPAKIMTCAKFQDNNVLSRGITPELASFRLGLIGVAKLFAIITVLCTVTELYRGFRSWRLIMELI